MTEITETTCLNIPVHITSDAHAVRWQFDKAFTTWPEARAYIVELEARGEFAKLRTIKSKCHCVYTQPQSKSRRPYRG